ncbi:MAG: hypothetical protein E4H23_09515 [Chrysiogenales bacterium]|nr:MAG: hypothetical protein E4H23_09515 [Chrysiogenales bacterium]
MFFSGCSRSEDPPVSPTPRPSHFGVVEAWVDYQEAQNLGFEIVRRFILWGRVQPKRDQTTWDWLDYDVNKIHEYGFDVLLTLLPFAQWDQNSCRQGATLFGPPCDIKAYRAFVEAIVERYDGDGTEDMPDLKQGVHFWEIFNEPALPGGTEGYEVTADEYLDLLENTYPIIKERCPGCEALQGGEAGVVPQTVSYIERYLGLGASRFFDIANVHFIHADFFDENLFADKFMALLAKYGVAKPVWITEVQIQFGPGAAPPGFSESEAAAEMVKAYVRAFGLGVERIFYTVVKANPIFPAMVNRSALIDVAGRRRAPYYAMKTMIAQLKGFSRVEKIAPCQYRFHLPDKPVYVLWGSGSLPPEITGMVSVFSVSGDNSSMEASSISLTESPIFVIRQ